MCKDSRKDFISQFQAVKWQASKKTKKLRYFYEKINKKITNLAKKITKNEVFRRNVINQKQ